MPPPSALTLNGLPVEVISGDAHSEFMPTCPAAGLSAYDLRAVREV